MIEKKNEIASSKRFSEGFLNDQTELQAIDSQKGSANAEEAPLKSCLNNFPSLTEPLPIFKQGK